MIPLDRIDMAEATRLTREGRLEEAMAVLCGARPSAGDEGGHGSGTWGARPARLFLDLVPPLPGTDGAWTRPGGDRSGPARRRLDDLAGGTWAMPDPPTARGAGQPNVLVPQAPASGAASMSGPSGAGLIGSTCRAAMPGGPCRWW